MCAVLSPISPIREGDGSLFCSLTRRRFFLRLSMIIDVMRPVLCYGEVLWFLKHQNLFIKLQPWLMFLWTTFCPCFLYITLSCSFFILRKVFKLLLAYVKTDIRGIIHLDLISVLQLQNNLYKFQKFTLKWKRMFSN